MRLEPRCCADSRWVPPRTATMDRGALALSRPHLCQRRASYIPPKAYARRTSRQPTASPMHGWRNPRIVGKRDIESANALCLDPLGHVEVPLTYSGFTRRERFPSCPLCRSLSHSVHYAYRLHDRETIHGSLPHSNRSRTGAFDLPTPPTLDTFVLKYRPHFSLPKINSFFFSFRANNPSRMDGIPHPK